MSCENASSSCELASDLPVLAGEFRCVEFSVVFVLLLIFAGFRFEFFDVCIV